MRLRLGLSLALSLSALACSTTRTGETDGGRDASVTDDRSATMDAPATDAPETDLGRVDAAGSDAGVPSDAGAGGPHPPAGYTQCGGASFSAMDVVTACESPPSIAGALPYPVDCAGATSAGGRYEIWCSPTRSDVYFWGEIDGVQAPTTSCLVPWDGGALPLTTYAEVGGARFVGATGPRGTDGDFMGSPVILDRGPMTVEIDGRATFGGSVSATGTLDVWIMDTPGMCPPGTGAPMSQYVMGIAASWAEPDA